LPRVLGDRLILFHLLRGLRSRGHHCEVVALSQTGDTTAILDASTELCDGLEVISERPRSPLMVLRRLAAPFPACAAACWHPAMWQAIRRRLDAGGIDVVHFLGGIQVYEHRDAARGWPRLIQPYESYSWWLSRAIQANRVLTARAALWLRRLVVRKLECRIYRGFDRVLVNAAPDERCLRALAPDLPLAVIPQGVDGPSEPVAITDRKPASLVFVGNFSYEPNVDAALRLAVEVLPLVRTRVPAATLTLVGVDPPPSLTRLGCDHIEVTGEVPDVFARLARARVFVSPLVLGAGMKNKVLEAMAAGTPVVATPESCDGLDLHNGEDALLATTPTGLADATVRVLIDDRLAAALARSARRLVEGSYRWSTVIGRYEALYADLMTSHAESARR
jgi:glycosyltransferase involved in cell wall biosynthesis